ncbi:hypothetical protein GCM10009069_05680 [Algimonas arctica]|uniref:Polysaccharide pyruvyl transferase domain-containing protein n=1 Tax=Algimonas arctica TaxID=1479486 RepID=A0A8J3G1I4_9PROT|nr:hypothetical protein GCM10009069_05680 [Algimonas arctica]
MELGVQRATSRLVSPEKQGEAEAPTRKPRLAIFRRHSLLDGKPVNYAKRPGEAEAHPFFGKPPFNVGDNFVSLALARILDVEDFCVLTHEAPEHYFDYVNEHCDAIIFVAQNCLFPGFFGKYLPARFIEKRIKIPIIFMSLGLQFGLEETPHLEEADVASLKALHERCVSSQVRGEQSADLLSRYGITNTRVVGCPSLFWSLNRDHKIASPSFDRVGWTITNMGSRPELDAFQTEAMSQLGKKAKAFIPICQGGEVVLQRHIIARDCLSVGPRTTTRMQLTKGEEPVLHPFADVSHEPWSLLDCKIEPYDTKLLEQQVDHIYSGLPARARRAVVEDSFFSFETHEYMRNAKSLSLMAGTRLHGNIMALSQGVPALFACHDRRVEEMADLFNAPRFDIRNPKGAFHLKNYDWSATNTQYRVLYDRFVDFLNENKLAHRL